MVLTKEELSKLPVSTKQQRIAEIARRKRGEPLTLLNHYMDEKWLCTAYSHLRKESAPGVDGQTVLEYGQNLHSNVRSLLKRAKTGTYRAPRTVCVNCACTGQRGCQWVTTGTTRRRQMRKREERKRKKRKIFYCLLNKS